MITAIFVDLDGVIFQGAERFSVKYAKEHDIKLDEMTPFFVNQFKLCVKGEANLKDELSKVLTEWKWKGTVDELVNYWVNDNSIINEQLINELNNYVMQNIKIYVVTQQEKIRSDHLQSLLGLKLKYTKYFSSHMIHYGKTDSKFYISCLKQSESKPNEVLFIDDNLKNITVAKEVGINTIFYENNKLTIDKISKIISENKG
jgi:FMN phosphatase YigB (HAD superfamily)